MLIIFSLFNGLFISTKTKTSYCLTLDNLDKIQYKDSISLL